MGTCFKFGVLVILLGNILITYGSPFELFPGIPGIPEFGGEKNKDSSTENEEDSISKFICPGMGRYAIRSSTKKNCSRYFECGIKDKKPDFVATCPKGEKFHRLSRSCVKGEYVNCKWCIKEGIHEDRTSKSHFLRCVPGTVAFRYKCRKGSFDTAKNKCKRTVHNSTMDITIDATPDLPDDIIEFQKSWNEESRDDKGKPIERVDSDEEKDGKKKDKDKDDKDEKEDKKEKKKESKEEKDEKKEKKDKEEKKETKKEDKVEKEEKKSKKDSEEKKSKKDSEEKKSKKDSGEKKSKKDSEEKEKE